MNAPTPVDPDKLRSRLSHAVEPVTPSPDALVQIREGVRRRRRLQWTFGSGAGVVAVAGGAAAVIAVGSLGHPSASPRTVEPGATTQVSPVVRPSAPASAVPAPSVDAVASVAAPPSLTATATATAPSPSAATPSTVTSAAVVSAAPTTSGAATHTSSPAAARPPVVDDVDGDGRSDTAVVEGVGPSSRLVVHLADRTVTSAPFALPAGYAAGTVTFASINRDGRSQMIVEDLGASARPYRLFEYANGAVTEVPAPAGLQPLWLVAGGGQNVVLSFDCTSAGLVTSHAGPTSLTGFVDGGDTSYTYTTATYRLENGVLVKVAGSTRTGLTRAVAMASAAAQPSQRCGAPI